MVDPPESPSRAASDGRGRMIQIAAIAPIALFLLFLGFSPDLRETLGMGLDLLLEQDQEGLVEWAEDRGVWAPLATTILMIAQAIAAPIPAVVVTFANSLLFGWVWGGVLSIAAANLAASLCYLLGRAWGEPVARRLVSEGSWARSESFLAEHGGEAILVSRLIPFVPFDPISYLAGVAGVRFRTFFFATLLGQIPAGMAYSWLATRMGGSIGGFISAGLLILAFLVIVGQVVRMRLRRRRKDASDEVGDDDGESTKTSKSSPQIG